MKIAFIGQRGVPATFGGVERHVEELGARMAADGHEVVVFCRRGYSEDEPTEHRGMRLVHQSTLDSKHLETIVASLRATLATIGRRYDVIHFHAVGPGLLTPLARLLTRARIVQTIHGLDAERAKWGFLASLPLRIGTWLSARVPHGTIVVSRALQQVYLDRYRRATTTIVNGCPDVTPLPAKLITERRGLTAGSYVLFVGRLVPEKAPDLLIEAFRQIPGDCRLVIAGGSSHTDDYVARLHELASEDERVMLAGYVYGDELAELYSNAAVFVLPSHLEGLPLTLLEAAAYGCSIVASDIPPHVEVLEQSCPGGRLFPAGDRDELRRALSEALDGDPATEAAGAAERSARVRAAYSWDRAAGETVALYRRLGAGRSRA